MSPTSSEVTRLLCQAVYSRPDRIKAVKAWWSKIRGKDRTEQTPTQHSQTHLPGR
ncbi:hypothetical protein ACWD64_20275 [Streptomyces antibioticus]